MIAYFDASALVKKYVEEPASDVVRELLRRVIPTTSRFTAIEVASALARRCREGDLAAAERDGMLSDLGHDLEAFYVVEVVPDVVEAASRLLLRYPLRSGDALQLASCGLIQDKIRGQVQFIAFDGQLNNAAHREGFTTLTPHSPGGW
ncbi:MAG: type II toxin-antitoxin system VapC family toxin [Acidobacteriota bacterium]